MNVQLGELPDLEVAYIRRVGSYFEPQDHWGRLIGWAYENSLLPPEQEFIGVSLDNPDMVPAAECRHDACVTLPAGFDKDSHKGVHFKQLKGGLFGVHSFYDTPEQLNSAYEFMFGTWLPESDHEPDFTRYNLEFNRNNPAEDPEGKCKVDLFVPVKKKI
ncbi:AraC family transcriptional regulator [Bacillus sp. FJAT-27225]|uniref:AraC family transcriptional regulator n=1 Tax=Bacillus sp. FJAT-27225 TaxID=1743144 RepID=UPI00080C24BC|nr:GyrI-like domain-containing protein [Bacillus sp. FJAT-27225]OCA84538.1 AraC family transcriptional regulator [Bacillus sp. FJAT-27225]